MFPLMKLGDDTLLVAPMTAFHRKLGEVTLDPETVVWNRSDYSLPRLWKVKHTQFVSLLEFAATPFCDLHNVTLYSKRDGDRLFWSYSIDARISGTWTQLATGGVEFESAADAATAGEETLKLILGIQ